MASRAKPVTKKKKKRKPSGPSLLQPRPPDELINIGPPSPRAVKKEKDQLVSMGSQAEVLVTYVCHYSECDLPDKKFQRVRKGGRAPLYCSDAHRSAANYQARGPGGGNSSTGRRKNLTDGQLLEFLLQNITLEVTNNNSVLEIPHQRLLIADTLVPSLTNALMRTHHDDPS